MEFAKDRNEYLHGGAAFQNRFPEDVWWSRYWSQAVLLLSAQDKDLDGFVGSRMVPQIEGYLAKNRQFVAELVEARVSRARQRMQLVASGAISARVAAELAAASTIQFLGADYEAFVDCPVCRNPYAKVGGSAIDEREDLYEEGSYTVLLTVGSDWFTCDRCGLVLDEYQYITESQVPDAFEVLDEDPMPEAEYGND